MQAAAEALDFERVIKLKGCCEKVGGVGEGVWVIISIYHNIQNFDDKPIGLYVITLHILYWEWL